MEGVRPARHRRKLPNRLLTAIVLIAPASLLLFLWPAGAWASDDIGQNVTSAHASVIGGTISVQAGSSTWTPPSSSTSPKSTSPSTSPSGSDSRTVSDASQPYGCTDVVPPAATQAKLGPGGPEPGQWVFRINCTGPGVINPEPPVWVVGAAQAAPAPAAPDPAVLAQQAESELPLASPTIEMAPPAGALQLVNVAAWLWLGPGVWQPQTATATAGPVTVTATAQPTEVVWTMGDGHQVTCDGPGTPYDPAQPGATSDCTYTWTTSSAGQPGGAYQVSATVYYAATWTVTGATGGGNLGTVPGPAARAAVRVGQSEALDTTGGD